MLVIVFHNIYPHTIQYYTYILILLLLLYHIKYDIIGRSSIFNHCDNDMFTHIYLSDWLPYISTLSTSTNVVVREGFFIAPLLPASEIYHIIHIYMDITCVYNHMYYIGFIWLYWLSIFSPLTLRHHVT